MRYINLRFTLLLIYQSVPVMRCVIASFRYRQGKMYTYDVSVMSVDSFVSFAEGWYVNAPSQPVPTEPTPL